MPNNGIGGIMPITKMLNTVKKVFDTDNVYDLDFDLGGSSANDFENSFVIFARWRGSDKELTEVELDILNDDSQFVYESLMDFLY
jgi:hypothetical protein